jgi:hypothetical protein
MNLDIAGSHRRGWKGSKAFFFEKKKQKTFASFLVATRPVVP